MDSADFSLGRLPKGGLPLYRKAEDLLRKLMADPQYVGGGLLPDEITLGNQLGVSRGTVRAAILRLVAEGSLIRKAGVGTRVVQRSTEMAIGAWRSFSREMALRGVEVQMFHLRLRSVPATPRVAQALQIEPEAVVQRLDRVRGWNDVRVLRSRSWFHPRVQFAADEKFARPLYDLIAEVSGLNADRASEAFSAEAASEVLARNLRVRPATPLLLRRHTVFDRTDRPLEVADVHYVSTRFTLTLDLKRGAE